MWKWDKLEVVGTIKIDPEGPLNNEAPMISFSPQNENYIIVTGGGIYKFFEYRDKNFKVLHSQMNDRNDSQKEKIHVTCHTWSDDSWLIVFTDEGEIIIC